MEMLSYYISLVITTAGLAIKYQEPFKTEEQILTEQHFERFRQHRQLSIQLSVKADEIRLRADLQNIDGIRRGSINVNMPTVHVSYQKDRITPSEILEELRKKGYVLKETELP